MRQRNWLYKAFFPKLISIYHDKELVGQYLRWVFNESRRDFDQFTYHHRNKLILQRLRSLSRGVPLQYVLGNQRFGDIVLKVQRGVLIPRWETEEWVTRLSLAFDKSTYSKPSIIDIGCGSGIIGMILASNLRKKGILCKNVMNVDINKRALRLARYNQLANYKHVRDTNFHYIKFDIFNEVTSPVLINYLSQTNILVSNPPYISADKFKTETDHLVKRFEPLNALLGNGLYGADMYVRIVDIVRAFGAKIKCLAFEINDLEQAQYIQEKIRMTLGWHNSKILLDSNGKARALISEKEASIVNNL